MSDWELASRLSYFLWSSLPDAELRAAAAAGSLREPEVLAAQTRRMLGDARVRRLATEFALPVAAHPRLRHARRKERAALPDVRGAARRDVRRVDSVLHRPVPARSARCSSILDADHTFLNEALAKHYGIPGVSGDGVAARGRREEVRRAAASSARRRRSRSNPARRAPARSCAATGSAKCCSAKSCRARRRTCRSCPRTRRRETLTVRQLVEKHTCRPALRRLPRADRPVRLRARELRRHRPPPRARTSADRPIDAHGEGDGRHARSTASTACATTC